MSIENLSSVAHYWANQTQDEARTGNNSFSFNGPVLTSYSTPIARIIPESRCTLITNEGYSVTTSRHLSEARQALSGLSFEVPDIGDIRYKMKGDKQISYLDVDHAANLKYLKDEIKDHVLKASRARVNAYWLMQRAESLLSDYNHYLDCFKIKRKKISIDQFDAEEMKAKAKAKKQAAAANKKAKAEKKKFLKLQKENIASWLNGADIRLSYQLPCYLRINKEAQTIETSKGANIPLNFCKILWRKIQQVRKEKAAFIPDYNHSFKVGLYTLDRIETSGNIKIGCHSIGYLELKRISVLLNY